MFVRWSLHGEIGPVRGVLEIVSHAEDYGCDTVIVPLENLADKCRAFGFEVTEIDGHDHQQIRAALESRAEGKPTCIISHTTKGKGLYCAENQASWHHKTPTAEQFEQMKQDLRKYREVLA